MLPFNITRLRGKLWRRWLVDMLGNQPNHRTFTSRGAWRWARAEMDRNRV